MGRPEVLVREERCAPRCGLNARKQRRLDFEIFGDGFNDPIALREPGQVIVEVAGRDERCAGRLE